MVMLLDLPLNLTTLPKLAATHTYSYLLSIYLSTAHSSQENDQAIAAHNSPRTTKIYDWTRDDITLDEAQKLQLLP
jgi:hypothetical protein